MCYETRVLPPKPKLFKAIAIVGMFLGLMGIGNAVTGLLEQSTAVPSASGERSIFEALLPAPTEGTARAARQLDQRMERVLERHRAVSVGLCAANGVLSLLLLAGALTLASGRPWAHWVMMQGLGASMLYELPAVAHQIRLAYEGMLVERRLLPELVRVPGQTLSPDDVAIVSGGALLFIVAVTIGLAALRLAFYGTGVWYLRRRDVRAWFSVTPRDV